MECTHDRLSAKHNNLIHIYHNPWRTDAESKLIQMS